MPFRGSVVRNFTQSIMSRLSSTGNGVVCFDFAMLLNLFGLFLVERREFASGVVLHPQQFVEFGMNSLRVAMLGPLDEERHDSRSRVSRSPANQRFSAKLRATSERKVERSGTQSGERSIRRTG